MTRQPFYWAKRRAALSRLERRVERHYQVQVTPQLKNMVKSLEEPLKRVIAISEVLQSN